MAMDRPVEFSMPIFVPDEYLFALIEKIGTFGGLRNAKISGFESLKVGKCQKNHTL